MSFELSILFAFGAMLCWGFGDFFIQKSTRKVGDIEALAFIGVVGSIGMIPFVINDIALLFSAENIALLTVLGVIIFITSLLDFEALKRGKLSVIDVVLEFELLVTILLGMIFFKEGLAIQQVLLIFVIFIGIVMIATKSFSHLKANVEKGVLLAFVASILMASINLLTTASSRNISPLMAVWVPWTIFTVLCLLLIWKREGFGKFVKNGMKYKRLLIAMGMLDVLAWIFYAFATFQNNMSIVTAITESYAAVALILGVWINKEKISWHQYLGAFVAILASFVLVFV